MSPTLTMVRTQLTRFQNGEICLSAMWDQIESNLAAKLHGEEQPDPFEDDKAERRIHPSRYTSGI